MFQTQEKSLIIVYNSDTKQCAEFMTGLIAQMRENGHPINAITINAKKFASMREENKSAKQKILYIGNFAESKVAFSNIHNLQFDKFGIKYGWHGNRAALSIDGRLSDDEFRKMAAFAESTLKEYEIDMEKQAKKSNKISKTLAAVAGGSLLTKIVAGAGAILLGKVAVVVAVAAGISALAAMARNKGELDPGKVKEHQQKFAVQYFCLVHLNDFMGIKDEKTID